MTTQTLILPLTLCAALLAPWQGLGAQEPVRADSDKPRAVTPEMLNAKIEEVAATADLDDATKSNLTELYRKSLSNLETETSNSAAADAYITAQRTASEEAREVRAAQEAAEQTAPEDTLAISTQTPLAEIEQRLQKEKADLAAVEAKRADLDKKLEYQSGRADEIRKRLTGAKQRQEEIAAELKAPPPEDQLPAVTEAKQWVLATQYGALSAEIRMLDQELLSQPMRLELLKAQRDKAAHSVEWVGVRVRLLEETLNQRRLIEAETAKAEAEAAKREAIGKHPLVQRVAAENAKLGEELRALAADLEGVTAAENAAREQAKRIEEDFSSAKQKLEIAGLSQALGQVLREQRRHLPQLRSFRKEAEKRERMIAESGLRQIRHDEERQRLRDMEAQLDALVVKVAAEDVEQVRAELRDLLNKRLELLDKMIATDDAYLRALGELDFEHRRLSEATAAYDEFLAERLLWIRSSPPVNLAALKALSAEIGLVLSPSGWREVAEILGYEFTHSPTGLLLFTLVALLLGSSRRMKKALAASGDQMGKPTGDRLAYTLQGLGLTLLLAVPWPLLIATLGWQLQGSLEATNFTKAIAIALLWVAPQFYLLRAFRMLCLAKGVAAVHFRWPESNLQLLRRQIRRLTTTFLPSAWVTLSIIYLDLETVGGALGKLAFVVTMAALASAFYHLLHPRTGVFHNFFVRHRNRPVTRLRYLWMSVAAGSPLLLAALALAGYLYTAATLTEHLINTLWLALVLVVVHQLAVRWLLLTRRQLAYQAALERREAARDAEMGKQGAQSEHESPLEVEQPSVDLAALSEESRKLLNAAIVFGGVVALWAIWSGVLPAFGILDEVSLWYHTAVVDGEEKRLPITLADAGLAILIVVATLVAGRSLPALLEIALLQRIQVSPGSRYAITTLSSYGIGALGLLLAFNTIGANWSQIQWLVAALGVGIGFGLQEIVANFISGLIILFERPIRVGDVVTVGDTDGVVTRIRIRATTIRNWDRKELLVPNKEFITGRLLNWSLSDQINRIVIIVGVAYDSDVERALELIGEVAREHAEVLDDPSPMVTFEGFGDNSLTLLLRCYLASLDNRLATITDLHKAINRKFKAAGIVIAYPQRDLHLDTSRPLDIRIQRGNPGGE